MCSIGRSKGGSDKLGTYKANTQIRLQSDEVMLWLNELNKRRKLGKVLGIALEYIYNSPDRDKILGDVSGITNELQNSYRATYNAQLSELTNKVNTIQSISQELRVLAKVGNRLGLEQKAESLELSTYIINRQIAKLSKTLGVDASEFKDLSNKTQDICDIVDLIIDSYGSMLSSLKVGNIVSVDNIVLEGSKDNIKADETIDLGVTNKDSVEVKSKENGEDEVKLADIDLGDTLLIGGF